MQYTVASENSEPQEPTQMALAEELKKNLVKNLNFEGIYWRNKMM